MTHSTDITIRASQPRDAAAIERLAKLDSRRAPRGRMLLAEVGGEIRAALPVEGGEAIADPFRHTAHLVRLLETRLGEGRRERRRERLARLVPAFRVDAAGAR